MNYNEYRQELKRLKKERKLEKKERNIIHFCLGRDISSFPLEEEEAKTLRGRGTSIVEREGRSRSETPTAASWEAAFLELEVVKKWSRVWCLILVL